MNETPPLSRIQKKNRRAILDAALDVFSQYGFRGTTLDQIAQTSGLSKPNLLYYFPTKEDIHTTLLDELMQDWQDPMRAIDPEGEPLEEILDYVQRKLEMSRDFPRESRLFANEILQGAPQFLDALKGGPRHLFDEKVALFQTWMDQGKLAQVHPQHLIFSIWSLTQHYADFEVQIRIYLGPEGKDPYPEAGKFLRTLFTRMLTP
ncbi:TetR family transcriptional regulator C-terminal domain-containing protein [Actibacterium sp.]|uniref:TetR family transcriptional regulator C-terminal domain-containing protein n=1 Tax=Actibacterium sp. TaxID=1872125 RepID=UPI003562E5C8